VIGPSGAGKTSFVRAGVVAGRPSGWKALVMTPGPQPFRALGRALGPALAGDSEALGRLADVEEPDTAVELLGRWRGRDAEGLLVVDQLEELFTQNPSSVQERFAGFLGRVARDAGVHVLLSLRDDFLLRCCEQEPLAPVLEGLTALLTLRQEDLRRALVEPAKREGFAFEDEALVAEMLEAVEGTRGALPLLAFAVSRLWETRDRDRKLLTRAAYEEIGGVAGALAQHAEQTLERIGLQREPVVRELFRNLVTAQWTRAAADREELLSVLPDREAGAQVLDQLVDARLLTSYEVRDEVGSGAEGGEGKARHRIEVVHESLLRAWPRLVKWQAQDEEGAVLRDQLKQAAHLWEEKGRPDDLLWTGTSEREFELWQDRYPGKLTALEDDFARAMVDRTRRRRRLRRVAVASTMATLLVVLTVIGGLWRRSVAEAQRAEASKLLALAQARLEDGPTEALAFATASLETSDTREARLSALKALWEAPHAFELPGGGQMRSPTFSNDGRWLATGGNEGSVTVWAETGERVAWLRGPSFAGWAPEGLLVTGSADDVIRVFTFPSGDEVRTIELGGPSRWAVQRDRLVGATLDETALAATQLGLHAGIHTLRSWQLPDGEAQELGQVDGTALGASSGWFEPNGTGWLYTKRRTIFLRPLPADGRADRAISHLDSDVKAVGSLGNEAVVFREESGRVHTCCTLMEGPPTLTGSFAKPDTAEGPVLPERSGRWLVASRPLQPPPARVWKTPTWPGARPLVLRRLTSPFSQHSAFHPTGDWVVVAPDTVPALSFWPLRQPYPTIVDGYTFGNRPLAFSPDSQWLATPWPSDRLRLWPVGEGVGPARDLAEGTTAAGMAGGVLNLAFEPHGRFLFLSKYGPATIVPLDGSPARLLENRLQDSARMAAAVSPNGRRVATAFSAYGTTEKTLRVWDLETGQEQIFDLPRVPAQSGELTAAGIEWTVQSLAFVGESTLYSAGAGGIRRWNLEDGTHELVYASRPGYFLAMSLDAEARTALVKTIRLRLEWECTPVELVDLRAGTARPLPQFGECPTPAFALSPSGTVAATGGRDDGLVRVGRLGAGEPHLLMGHEGAVASVALSPDLRWVASSGVDGTLRLWPMPDLDQPPLHTLPHDELIAKLKSLTNLRAVRDANDPTGWKIVAGPFPGWTDTPEW
jgi:WD40 repeat protein